MRSAQYHAANTASAGSSSLANYAQGDTSGSAVTLQSGTINLGVQTGSLLGVRKISEGDATKAAAGKNIVYHDAADGAFSLQATIDWYEKVRANNGGDASGFARFYPVPGMTHCGGGPSTDRAHLFGALVDWVEHGKAPDSPVATAASGPTLRMPASCSR